MSLQLSKLICLVEVLFIIIIKLTPSTFPISSLTFYDSSHFVPFMFDRFLEVSQYYLLFGSFVVFV